LQREFRAFLDASNADSDEALLTLWFAQGAEAWDFDLTVRPVMTDFYRMMNPEAPELEKPTGSPTDVTFHMGLKPRRSTS
jgi:hypothetical protein